MALAAGYDEWIVAGEGVDAREIEVAVLGNAEPRASVPGEIVTSHGSRLRTSTSTAPASWSYRPLGDEASERVQALALDAYRPAVRRHGPGRLLLRGGPAGFLVSEVNTIPGFTPSSMYPRL